MERFSIFMVLTLGISCICDGQKDCRSSPPKIANSANNSTGTPPYLNGTSLLYTCDKGYREYSSAMAIVCLDGKWEGKFGCIKKKCKKISPPKNGFFGRALDTAEGSELQIRCNPGYRLIGSNSRVCGDEGNWKPTVSPVCEPVNCGDYGEIEHASINQTSNMGVKNSYGSRVFVTCDEGYLLNGWSDIPCGSDGMWDHIPECIHSPCGSHPAQKSSCISESEIGSDGTVLNIVCLDDSPSVSVTELGTFDFCQYGTWDRETIGCFCDCKIRADFSRVSAKNVDINKFLKHSSTLDWECQTGFKKKDESSIKCFDGKVATPECVLGEITLESKSGDDTALLIGLLVLVIGSSVIVLVVFFVACYNCMKIKKM